jgi:putative MATE family efflux protein
LKKWVPLFSILKTSLPAALDLASQPVMWLIEAVLVGRLSAAALGGVGFALQIILLTCTVLLTFVMGAIILINRHLGSRDRWGANHILGQTLMAGFMISVLIGIIWFFGAPFLFKLIREKEMLGRLSPTPSFSGMDSGIQYLKIVSLFAPVIISNFMAISIIRGTGDTHVSMMINVTMNIANLVLAPILIYGLFGLPRMEVKGAALAVGCAHTLGFSLTLFYLRRATSTLFLSFKELTTPNWNSFKQLFKMGLPTTVEQLVWSVGQFVIMGYVALLGITELAIHNVFLRLQGVLSMFYLGFGLTAMTHVGKNLGANEHSQAEHSGKVTHRTALVFVLIIVITMIVFSSPLLHLFIRKEDAFIADYRFRALFIVFSLVQIPKAMNTVIVGSLRGAGDIKWIMWINIVGVFFLEIGMNWIGTFLFHLGLMGIWSIQGLDEIVKSLINFFRFRKGKWKLIRV